MIREYKTIREVCGPLMLVSQVEGVVSGELGEIELKNGEKHFVEVVEREGDVALVRLYAGAEGVGIADSKVRFFGRGLRLAVSEDILGRVFDGLGRPIDGGPKILADAFRDVNGAPANPAARAVPETAVETGVSAIDGLNTLYRGQKLALFSAAGLPHAALLALLARQAKAGDETRFALVFAGVGLSFEATEGFIQELRRTGAIDRTVIFSNLAGACVTERLSTPRMAMTAAEYLAYEKDMHVLVILSDMTAYADGLRELSAARKEPLAENGSPVGLQAELAAIYERAGLRVGKAGSITLIPALTLTGDALSDPPAAVTAGITEGQLVLSRELLRKAIVPPVDVLSSCSRMMDCAAETERYKTAQTLIKAYAEGKQAQARSAAFGPAVLSEADRQYLAFADLFERDYIRQSGELCRTQDETLALGRQLLATAGISDATPPEDCACPERETLDESAAPSQDAVPEDN